MIKKKKKLFFLVALLFVINILMASALFFVYHNRHTAPMTSENISEDVASVSEQKLSFQELTDHFTQLAEKKGAAYAFEVLRNASLPLQTDFHLLAHSVGDVLYEQEGVNGIKICTDDFRNACSHSIVISLFRKYGEKAVETIANVCKKAPGGKGAYGMCFHGLGHGVLAYAEYDFEKAISLCDKTGTEAYGKRESVECIGGATMEMANGVHDVDQWKKAFPNYFITNDPLSPCNQPYMPDAASQQCYFYITPHLFDVAGANGGYPTPQQFQEAFTYCDAISPSDMVNREGCYGGFGKEFIVLVQDRDIRKMESLTEEQLRTVNDWCSLAGSDQSVTFCLLQASNSLYWGGENGWQTPVKLCDSTNNAYKNACYTNMIENVAAYNDDPSYRETFCKAIPASYQTDCSRQLLSSG